ncbi:MAG: type IVB secretion system protein IcmG/DotF [Legionella sp.]
MAEKEEFNDEYQFTALDDVLPQAGDEALESLDKEQGSSKSHHYVGPSPIKRNVMIVIAIIILSYIAYKIIGSYFFNPISPIQANTMIKTVSKAPQALPKIKSENSANSIDTEQSKSILANLQQKLSALESNQENVHSAVGDTNNQLESLSNSITSLSSQLAQLQQDITILNERVNDESKKVQALASAHKKKVIVKKTQAPAKVKTIYYVQAVIPGRAWLISPNGTTLTVSEGTMIPEYGFVKLIDPNQGKILTSSGQVIRFSQADS